MNPPNIIDLFSGVGGLSLGAARAGFTIVGSVEIDPIAMASHTFNFPNTNHLQHDVSALAGKDLLKACDIQRGSLAGLIGGPPCQGFSLIGKRNKYDPRNEMFCHFFRLVAETRPAFYVVENVLGILREENEPLIETAHEQLPSFYKQLAPFKVRASDYGAPTTRTRVFYVGYDPSRIDELTAAHFLPPVNRAQVKVKDALKGLPDVNPDWQHESQSWRTIRPLGFSHFEERISGHTPKGVGNSTAIRLCGDRKISGFLGTRHTEATIKRFEMLRPGQVDEVYRSPRLDPNGFCPTLRAGTNSDKGSFQAVRPIHPRKPRVITPREAARLQGFPDWFVFNPTKWHSFRQIGNSVSPLVAEELMARMARALGL